MILPPILAAIIFSEEEHRHRGGELQAHAALGDAVPREKPQFSLQHMPPAKICPYTPSACGGQPSRQALLKQPGLAMVRGKTRGWHPAFVVRTVLRAAKVMITSSTFTGQVFNLQVQQASLNGPSMPLS